MTPNGPVAMVEHLFAALHGLAIDDIDIDVELLTIFGDRLALAESVTDNETISFDASTTDDFIVRVYEINREETSQRSVSYSIEMALSTP